MNHIKKISTIAFIGLLSTGVYAGNHYHGSCSKKKHCNKSGRSVMSAYDQHMHLRISAAFGPRYLNDDVMENTAWGTAMQLGLGMYKHCKTKNCYYGVETRANNAWDARFNSVNEVNNTTTGTLLVHNSASMDFMLFMGKDWGKWSAEVGAGMQISWVKWLNSQQNATDRVRVLPKLRFALNRKVARNIKMFVALSQAFNPYDSLKCSSGATNCFNDAGFVGSTNLMLGVSKEL